MTRQPLCLAPPEELELLAWRFCDTASSCPTELCVHELVSAQASRSGASVALEWQESSLTYTEMQQLALGVSAAMVGRC